MSTQPSSPPDATQDDTFRVLWAIDLSATSAREAAQRALEIQRNPASIATHFEVTRHGSDPQTPATIVDFHEDPDPSADAGVSDDVYATRRQRFNDILDGYECDAGDWTMPSVLTSRERAMRALPSARVAVDGAAAASYLPGRYALVCESTRGHGYFVTNLTDRAAIDTAVAENLDEGWQPVCYFDLDELAGDEPPVFEGDVVEYAGAADWHVIRTEDDHAEGVMFQWLHIDKDPAAEWLDGAAKRVDACECTVVQRADADTRMPVRYGLSRITVAVAFNTVPSP